MEIIQRAQAGSFESSDILVLVEPVEKGKGRNILIESAVKKQYGQMIESLIIELLDKYQVNDIHLVAHDKGAINPVISARVETVLMRAADAQQGTMYQ